MNHSEYIKRRDEIVALVAAVRADGATPVEGTMTKAIDQLVLKFGLHIAEEVSKCATGDQAYIRVKESFRIVRGDE